MRNMIKNISAIMLLLRRFAKRFPSKSRFSESVKAHDIIEKKSFRVNQTITSIDHYCVERPNPGMFLLIEFNFAGAA